MLLTLLLRDHLIFKTTLNRPIFADYIVHLIKIPPSLVRPLFTPNQRGCPSKGGLSIHSIVCF